MIDVTPPLSGRPAGSRLLLAVNPVGRVVPGDPFEVTVRLTVAAGYHVQGHERGDPAMAKTSARLRAVGSGAAITQEWRYPPAGAGGYGGTVAFTARCVLPAGMAAGKLPCRAIVEAQACSDVPPEMCHAPEQVTAEFSLEVVADG